MIVRRQREDCYSRCTLLWTLRVLASMTGGTLSAYIDESGHTLKNLERLRSVLIPEVMEICGALVLWWLSFPYIRGQGLDFDCPFSCRNYHDATDLVLFYATDLVLFYSRLLTDHFFQFGSLLVEVWLHGSNRVHHNGFKCLRIGLVRSRGPRILNDTVHGFSLSPRILNATVSNFRGFLTTWFCTISTD